MDSEVLIVKIELSFFKIKGIESFFFFFLLLVSVSRFKKIEEREKKIYKVWKVFNRKIKVLQTFVFDKIFFYFFFRPFYNFCRTYCVWVFISIRRFVTILLLFVTILRFLYYLQLCKLCNVRKVRGERMKNLYKKYQNLHLF